MVQGVHEHNVWRLGLYHYVCWRCASEYILLPDLGVLDRNLLDLHTACAMAAISSIRTSGDRIEIIDQLLLPHTQEWIEIDTIEKAHDAIKSMKVRYAS